MMGSPEDEPERYDDEYLHEVTLTDGFWLAETTCTQELWEVVMHDTPSRFKGKRRPVERVSWEDCMAFINQVNDKLQGLHLRLPTEAEWEYACRAGTITPFSFGANITADQVNYNGNKPYAGAKKGEYRGQTVETRSLACNAWGLYEMHGNVWEWCADWYGKYSMGAADNPVGPADGTNRVLRGGSWFNDGWFVRSACRYGSRPGFRNDGTGFRLARGHNVRRKTAELKVAPDEEAGPDRRSGASRSGPVGCLRILR